MVGCSKKETKAKKQSSQNLLIAGTYLCMEASELIPNLPYNPHYLYFRESSPDLIRSDKSHVTARIQN